MSERKAFEKWAQDCDMNLRVRSGGQYFATYTQVAWISWQAALRGECTEPNRNACPRHCMDFCNESEERKAALASIESNAWLEGVIRERIKERDEQAIVSYSTHECPTHKGQPFTMQFTAVTSRVGITVCPICHPPKAAK